MYKIQLEIRSFLIHKNLFLGRDINSYSNFQVKGLNNVLHKDSITVSYETYKQISFKKLQSQPVLVNLYILSYYLVKQIRSKD